MKKIALISVLAIAMIFANSCKEENEEGSAPNGSTTETTGTYELKMEGNLVKHGTSTEIGMVQDADGNYTANASISNGNDISLLATDFSMTVGESVTIVNGGPQVTIQGRNLLLSDNSDETYFATSGTLTRVSSSKISFEGTCAELQFGDQTPYSFSGFIESEAYKNLK